MLSTELASAIVDGGRRGRVSLTALYDPRCPLCRKLKSWLCEQPSLAPVEFLAAGGSEARRRYPDLDHERTTRILTVVAESVDAGVAAVYEGERAWLVCAWALPAWQPVAERVGTRHGLALVRAFTRLVDAYRRSLISHDADPQCRTCHVTAPRRG